MADLTAMRAGLAANLATLTDIQVSAYMLANPTPPTIHLYPADTEYDLAMARGLDRWYFTVQVFCGVTGDIAAQVRLDAFVVSAKPAIESDQTLGGSASSAQVLTFSGYRTYVFEGRPPLLGAEWRVEVLATGS
jgi:hypothetical protein